MRKEEKDESIEVLGLMFIAWSLGQMPEGYECNEFIAGVLRKRLEVFGVDVNFSDILVDIIALQAGGNPGVSQLILKEILTTAANKFKIKKVPKGYTIDPMDYAFTYQKFFVLDFEDYDDEKVKEYHNKWDAQKKLDGTNRCDTAEYWQEVVEC